MKCIWCKIKLAPLFDRGKLSCHICPKCFRVYGPNRPVLINARKAKPMPKKKNFIKQIVGHLKDRMATVLLQCHELYEKITELKSENSCLEGELKEEECRT